MTSRLKKAGYTTAVGLGLFGGAAGIAAAANSGNGSTSSTPAATAPASAAADTPEANDTPDGVETNDGVDEQDQAPTYTSSVTAPSQAGGNEADEGTALEALATITADQASAAATGAVPGTVNKVELENENGSVVYSVEIATATGTVDVKIDAGNAAVLAQETDDHGEHGDGDHADGGHHSNTDPAHEASESAERTAEEATQDGVLDTTPAP